MALSKIWFSIILRRPKKETILTIFRTVLAKKWVFLTFDYGQQATPVRPIGEAVPAKSLAPGIVETAGSCPEFHQNAEHGKALIEPKTVAYFLDFQRPTWRSGEAVECCRCWRTD